MLVQFSITSKSGKTMVYKFNRFIDKPNTYTRYYKGRSNKPKIITAEEYGKAMHFHRNEWENRNKSK